MYTRRYTYIKPDELGRSLVLVLPSVLPRIQKADLYGRLSLINSAPNNSELAKSERLQVDLE